MANVLIVGCGYVGTALGLELRERGHAVWGLRRRAEEIPAGLGSLRADVTDAGSLDCLPRDAEFVFYTVAADATTERDYRAAYVDGLANSLEALARQGANPRRVFFTSSTAVYGQHNGEWVQETSRTDPTSFTGRVLLDGERRALAAAFPVTVVRLGGIYGPGRDQLARKVRNGTARLVAGNPHYTNRIHRDDCVGVLAHLMSLEAPQRVYLAVDCEPVEHNALVCWLAEQLAVEPPAAGVRREHAGWRAAGSKRCRNGRLVAGGYHFRHPTFREGYRAVLEDTLREP